MIIRRLGSGSLLETFLVSAIGTVLVIRAVLAMTNYPQLGGGGLHIAHMLWGGLAMMVAMLLLLATVGPISRTAASLIGGVGFGFFIDELGKFITSDNNYFYRPAVPIIYVVFIFVYLAIHGLDRLLPSSPRTHLANAAELATDAICREAGEAERQRRRSHVACADMSDPVTQAVATLLDTLDHAPASKPGMLRRLVAAADNTYRRIAGRQWFHGAVLGLFALGSLGDLLQTGSMIGGVGGVISVIILALLVVLAVGWIAARKRGRLPLRILAIVAIVGGAVAFAALQRWIAGFETLDDLRGYEAAQLVAAAASGLLVVAGVLLMRRSRLLTYRLFMAAILISLFVGQVFAFYREQFWALIELGLSLTVWLLLRYLIREEKTLLAEHQPPGRSAS